MAGLLRMCRRSPAPPTPVWSSDDIKHKWVSNNGCIIHLQDDVAICVSALEDDCMRRLAVNSLAKCGIFVLSEEEIILGQSLIVSSLVERETSIFGVTLAKALEIERRLHTYPVQNINAKYKFHLPYYYVSTIICLTKYGLSEENILQDYGNPLWLHLMHHQLRQGMQLYYDNQTSVHEFFGILKIFLRELPGGLFTEELKEYFFLSGTLKGKSNRVQILRLLIQALPRPNREALFLLISFLRQVALEEKNAVDTTYVAKAFRGALFHNKHSTNLSAHKKVITTLIVSLDEIFTLEADTLDSIYKKLAVSHPVQLDSIIKRRIGQCHWMGSDIPEKLFILAGQRRTFETCKFEAFHGVDNGPSTHRMVEQFLERAAEANRLQRRYDESLAQLKQQKLHFPVQYFPRHWEKTIARWPKLERIAEEAEYDTSSDHESWKDNLSFILERRHTI